MYHGSVFNPVVDTEFGFMLYPGTHFWLQLDLVC